jgi:uncharacterized membrane protein
MACEHVALVRRTGTEREPAADPPARSGDGSGAGRRTAASVTLVTVLAATLVTLGVFGTGLKAQCAAGTWGDGRQYRHLCYSDIVPLYGTEDLSAGRLPYLDPCPAAAGEQCDEYPVLTMYFLRAAAWLGHGFTGFFIANAMGLLAAALVTAWALYELVGARALYFAMAPTLLIYGFVNWDLLAVALATVGTLLFVRRRDGWSGILLGLGAAAKFYPALLVIPFVLHRLRERRRGDAAAIGLGAAGAYAAVNIPFILLAPHAWSTFFRFNVARPVDWDSLWFVACQRMHGNTGCGWPAGPVNRWSLVAFVALAGLVWLVRRAREPGFPAWTFAFPLLVAFLLTNKVYSPQYGVWLLPLFALALPRLPLFVAFEVADIAVFVTRFTWFGRLGASQGDPAFAGFHGAPLGAFEFAVVLRAAVLVACLGAWALGERGRHAIGTGARAAVGVGARAASGPLEAPA